MRNPGSAVLRLEDRNVDVLAEAVARETGAALLVAHAPRAMIDLKRAPDDIDWEMFGHEAADVGSYTPSKRARSGLGVIPRRLPGFGELWKRRHEEDDLAARISSIHEPYHRCLAHTLARLRRRWGAALLLDMHSMPPLALRGSAVMPEFVLGDRFGAACDGGLVGSAFAYFGEMGRRAAHNRPYAGGYVLERHASPERRQHALQLEIDRGSYLDSRLDRIGEGFAVMVQLLSGLVRRLAAEVADLGREEGGAAWAQAAE
jgi:N-formylglutamate amidohydrolase